MPKPGEIFANEVEIPAIVDSRVLSQPYIVVVLGPVTPSNHE